MSEYKATNIDWDIDTQDAAEYAMTHLDEKKFKEIFQASNLNIDDVVDKIHHEPALADAIYDLPKEVVISAEVVKEAVEAKTDEMITDYLSNEYGFTINNYELPKALEKAIQTGQFEKKFPDMEK